MADRTRIAVKPQQMATINNQTSKPNSPYQEGTADDDGNNDKKQVNIPGPNEVPDQQKVGE